jgi:glutamate racemase
MNTLKSELRELKQSHGKLGFFDSWVGGLSVMAEYRALHPELDIVYFGDRANCPYGERSPDEILALTLAGVERLVEAWCVIIIIACNTAAAHAIVYLQNIAYLPGCGVKILGVTLPGVEAAVKMLVPPLLESWVGIDPSWEPNVSGKNRAITHKGISIWVLATPVTVHAQVYTRKIKERLPNAKIIEVAAPGLTNLIEQASSITSAGEIELPINTSIEASMHQLLHHQLSLFAPLVTGVELPSILILGCTHYPIIQPLIEKIWYAVYQAPILIIDPGKEAAHKFYPYLIQHPEFSLKKTATVELILS